MKRTTYCGIPAAVSTPVVLVGWVHRRRDHGGLIFIDLRDREGIVQIVFDPKTSATLHEQAHALRPEYVIEIQGTVALRPVDTENPALATGTIEIRATNLTILNPALTPPFLPTDEMEPDESLRLKYRYLDLRRPLMQKRFVKRHQMMMEIRRFLDTRGFIEVETPYLTRSTPEGARDFLVPSRLNCGAFYALPQSPQLFKQTLMISGFDRYYQIVRCFRDEDLRADRQPEFTQVDIEMSFVEPSEIMHLMEEMISLCLQQVSSSQNRQPFPVLTYQEAMRRFGSDKPDLRFGMELHDISDIAAVCTFNVFRQACQTKGGRVKGIAIPGFGLSSRKEIDTLVQEAIDLGAKGLAWMKVTGDGVDSPIAKFFEPGQIRTVKQRLAALPNDLLIFVADSETVTHQVLGALRLKLARRLNLLDPAIYKPLWVTDFPLLEYDAAASRYVAVHHPFTAPMDEDLPLLSSDPLAVRSKAYDMVLNGTEIGGGSIRIHQHNLQAKILGLLGMSEEEARAQFGFLLTALQYGAPPHGGIAQ